MGNKGYILGLLVVLMSLSSCFKDDEPIILPDPENTIGQVEMGGDYKEMVYYDFSTGTSYDADLNSWDLAFSFMENGKYDIHLNGGKGMYAALTEINNFAAPIDVAELKFKWDGATGHPDSTAIGDWWNQYNLYIVDRGPLYKDDNDRYKKLYVYDAHEEYYEIFYCSINHKSGYYKQVCKQEGKNFGYFSFETGACIDIEPMKEDWDVVFTRNIYTFHESNPPLPYIVTTVLINPYKVTAAADSTTNFADINLNHASSLSFSTDWDVIGWDWKEFDQTQGLYTVKDYKNYVIKDGEGHMYKLRFLDFYSKNRERGYPKFEYTRIK